MKLITLNIEASKHLDKWIPFVKKENPDLLCLQEVKQDDFDYILKQTGLKGKFFKFAETTSEWGLALLSKKGCAVKEYIYSSEPAPMYGISTIIDRKILYTEINEVVIATTHFSWTINGEPDDNQRRSMNEMLRFLERYDKVVLCGDFNIPRGTELYYKITEKYTDNLPKEIESTLDPKLHRKPELRLAVDNIYTKNIQVENVKVQDGLSDHMAISGKIIL